MSEYDGAGTSMSGYAFMAPFSHQYSEKDSRRPLDKISRKGLKTCYAAAVVGGHSFHGDCLWSLIDYEECRVTRPSRRRRRHASTYLAQCQGQDQIKKKAEG